MKFSNYYLIGNNLLNIGDYLILESKRHIYTYMGIKNGDVVDLSNLNINSYNGEKLVLSTHNILLDLPHNIIPCYTGLFIYKKLSRAEVDHLKQYQPVTCRDYYTYKQCTDNGIKAYYTGCTTIVLPRRERGNSTKKNVYLVDIPKDAEAYIPVSVIKDAVHVSQLVNYKNEGDIQGLYNDYYLTLLNEAKLVITSRFHCAMFCLNHGIPLIALRENFTSRFTFINQFTPVYDKKRWNEVDYNPKPYFFEESLKHDVLEIISGQLWETYHKHKTADTAEKVSNHLLAAPQNDFISLESYIESAIDEKLPDKSAGISFSVWGVNWWSEIVYRYISENYPNAVLVNVYDAYRTVEFNGHISKPIHELKNNIDSEICFVCCGEDVASRVEMMEELGISEEQVSFIKVQNWG